MATISSVSFYLSKTSNRTGWNMYCSIMDIGLYTKDPGDDTEIGKSNAVSIDSIPNHGSEDWVTFTFGTPVTISTTGFYALKLWGNTTSYQVAGVYVYDSDDWSDASGGEPYTDKERGWKYTTSGGWAAGITPAYNMVYNGVSNSALTPTATYSLLGQYTSDSDSGTGIRAHLGAPPEKPITPSPTDSGTDVTLDHSQLTWEDGGGTDTFDVYFGESGSEVLQSSTQAVLTWTISFGTLDYGTTYGWRIDATNSAGTTTGDTWTFTTISFVPPVPTPTNTLNIIKRLVAAAANKIWYENI